MGGDSHHPAAGKVRRTEAIGWQNRDNRRADADIVNCIDFERAIDTLRPDEKTILVLKYRDREAAEAIAMATGCSIRKVVYTIPKARAKLAHELDRLNLL